MKRRRPYFSDEDWYIAMRILILLWFAATLVGLIVAASAH